MTDPFYTRPKPLTPEQRALADQIWDQAEAEYAESRNRLTPAKLAQAAAEWDALTAPFVTGFVAPYREVGL